MPIIIQNLFSRKLITLALLLFFCSCGENSDPSENHSSQSKNPQELILNAAERQRIGDYDEAITILRRVLELDPQLVSAYIQMGQVYGESDQRNEAIESFKKAVQLDPSFGEAYYRLGLTYDIQNQSYDAISNLLVTELVFHKAKKMDLFKKTRSVLESLFAKYQASREDFKDLQVPETLKGYDLHKRNQIRTSKEK